MSTRNNDEKNGLSITRIETSDTISQFMEKCNNNFSNLLAYGGGTVGAQGEHGDQGVPTKPKVPIHIWIQKGEEHDEEYHYITEESTSNNEFEITSYTEDLSKAKYQEGHLIILQNAHVYSLENDGGVLKPKFKLALQSYDKNNVIDGKNAYVHIAYSNTPTPTSREDFVTDQQLREENNNTEPVETYSLKRSATTYSTSTTNMDYAYMGIYSDNTEKPSVNPSKYTWVRIQGQQGIQGIQGEQGQQGIQGIRGEQGDAFTGQPFSIDLSGDMSTLSLDTNGRSLYNDGSNDCKCTLHAYYGKEKHKLSFEQDLITITPPSSDYDIIKPDMTHAEVVTKDGTKVGDIQMYVVDGNIDITFRPDSNFDFLKKTIPFTIGVGTIVNDTNDNKKYTFTRNTIWIIKGIVSDFKLDIKPQYRIIKRLEDGNYYPKNLEVSVYKTIGGKRELFDFNDNENQSFKLLCNVDNKGWGNYPTGGVSTENTTHLEFKVVKVDKNAIEEIWDYEDVWVVADGKGTHYYHADLGNTESMMVLTTGEKEVVGTDPNENKIYCAKLRNKSGYSITFNPKFYDGTTPITVINASVQTNIGDTDIYVNNGSFAYEDDYDEGTNKLTLTITKVPYDIDTLPLLVYIYAKYDIYDEETGNVLETKDLFDTVDFNVYISTITNIYSLVPTAAAYNTSTGKTGDTIGCDVYKNNEIIPISDLNQNGLTLKYIVYSESGSEDEEIEYTEPIIYGDDSDIPEDEFTASDVAIVFILYYGDKEVVRSTVPLIKDGIDGRDGDTWQYIFCRSPYYDFAKTGISDPSEWRYDPNPGKSNAEYLGELESDYPIDENENLRWYDDHKGVDSDFRYEYQAYRKWDKYAKCWGKYGKPTLYSNYSEDGKDGSGYNVMLSNPVSVIPVGHDDWSVNENSDNQKDYTFIYLYNNTTDITSETDETGKNKVSISLPEDNKYVQNGNFTVDNNAHKVSFIPVFGEGDDRSVFDFQSNTQYKLPITVTYELGKDIDGDGIPDIFTTTVYWTLTPIKGLSDVEVFVDKKVVNVSTTDTHKFRVGYYLISTSGGKTFIESRANGDNKYNIVLRDSESDLIPGTKLENISDNDKLTYWNNVKYDFVDNDGKNKNCYVVLVDNSDIIIDYTTITSIKDGADGVNGADGASAMHLELTQDYIAVPASANGNGLHKNFIEDVNSKIQSRMILYNGDTKITKDITYIFRIDGENASSYISENNNGIFTVDKSKITGDTNIECVATYTPTGASFYKTLFIDVESTPYELEIDKNTLSRKVVSVDENGNIKDGYIVDGSINVKVKYWKNGSWCYVTDGDVLVEYIGGEIHFTKDTSNKTYTLTITEDNIKKNITDLEVKIVYMENDDILSYENIGIINNGVDGVTKFKSTVFARSVDKPTTKPSGGSFGDPNPSNREIWKDGIPEGSKPIWSSYRWFSNEKNFVSDWSDAVLMCDTPDFEVMYSSLDDISKYNPNEAIENTPFYKDTNGGIEGWLNETGLINKWLDDGGTDSIWMATINKTNGKWGNWTISKIKGENGSPGSPGATGDTPELLKTERIGFSTTEYPIPDGEIGNNYLSKWKASIGDLGDLGIAQPIYILYKQTWKYKNSTSDFPTYYITTTLSGTQGVEGKSRVLFYLGSFKEGEATLTDDFIMGHLTPERCDYYIDLYGTAWMRIGQEDKNGVGVDGYKDGNSNSSESWQKSDTVGFLQAGAIHANMINTDTITANSEIVTKLFSEEITANNLKVNAANITGTLTIGSGLENEGVSLNGTLSSNNIAEGAITSTKIQDGAITTGKIATKAITADKIAVGTITAKEIDVANLVASEAFIENLQVTSANISGKLSANNIDVDNLSIKTLDTKPDTSQDKISISNNYIYCLSEGGERNLKISSDDIDMHCLNALFTPINKNNFDSNDKNTKFNKHYNTNYYSNESVVTFGLGLPYIAETDDINTNGSCTKIGYLFADTTISINLSVALSAKTSTSQLPIYSPIAKSDWEIVGGIEIAWGESLNISSNTVIPGVVPYTGGYLLLYKFDDDKLKYTKHKQIKLTGTWTDSIDDDGNNLIFTFCKYKIVDNITIDKDGLYAFEIVLEKNSIRYTPDPSLNLGVSTDLIVHGGYKIVSNLPKQYTEIGKNGLVSFNTDNAIALDSSGVIMKSKNFDDETGTYNFYGLKVDTSGIYIGDNNNNWKKLNLDKMIELGIIENNPLIK